MFHAYRPADFPAVAAFARRQPEFEYLKAIIRMHEEARVRGARAVWRESNRVIAFCAVAFPNPRDAWLYGMRVDDRFKGQGIATRLTRALFGLARQAGRTWVALDTKDVASKAPVFRICDRLGMTHLATHATTMLWNSGLPDSYSRRQGHGNGFCYDLYFKKLEKRYCGYASRKEFHPGERFEKMKRQIGKKNKCR